MSAAVRLRVGLLLGLLGVLVAPPVVVSLDGVRDQVLRATGQSTDPAGAPLLGDRAAPDVTPGGKQPKPTPTSGGADAALRKQIEAVLAQQDKSLLTGDLNGYLAAVDGQDATLRATMQRRFSSLRAMKIAGWQQALSGNLTAGSGGTWSVPVQMRYCFVVANCTTVGITADTRWTKSNGAMRLLAFGSSTADQIGPRPWETSELTATVGGRVVVASTSKWASRLPAILASAERAASVTDRFAKWSSAPPDRYVVYLAGPDDWANWYGVQQASWVAAYAMPITDTYTEIVLNATRVGTFDAKEVLQHEFTHVVTLWGVHRSYPGSWWMVEGIAEYVQNVGLPVSSYRALAEGKRYAKAGWNGSIAVEEPSASASTLEANGKYAVAYLAVRRIAERFSEPKMLAFFAAVARDGTDVEAAAPKTLGASWADVSGDCVRYVRHSLGVG